MREIAPTPRPQRLAPEPPAGSLRGRAMLALVLVMVAGATWHRARQARATLGADTQRLRQALQVAEDPEALRLVRAAIPLAPDDPHLAALVMDTLARLQQPAEAIPVGRRALSRYPEAHGLRLRLGLALAADGKYDQAGEELREVIRVLPKSSRAHRELGRLAHRRGDLAEACDHYRTALAVSPEVAELHTSLGSALADRKDLTGAEASFRRALELAPEDPEAATNLAMILLRRNQREEARTWFARALELDPEHSRAREGLASLEQLEADGL